MKRKIALDCQVSVKTANFLVDRGFQVVFRANQEWDELWTNKAKDLGATVFISPDSDIEEFCARRDFIFIKIPQGLGKKVLRDYLIKKLKEVK